MIMTHDYRLKTSDTKLCIEFPVLHIQSLNDEARACVHRTGNSVYDFASLVHKDLYA